MFFSRIGLKSNFFYANLRIFLRILSKFADECLAAVCFQTMCFQSMVRTRLHEVSSAVPMFHLSYDILP